MGCFALAGGALFSRVKLILGKGTAGGAPFKHAFGLSGEVDFGERHGFSRAAKPHKDSAL